MVESLTVKLGERSYPLEFGVELSSKVQAQIGALEREGRKVVALTDRNLARRQPKALHGMLGERPIHVVEPGEETKSLVEFGRVLDFLAEQRIDRTGVLFAVGGGVIGDLGGFAAA